MKHDLYSFSRRRLGTAYPDHKPHRRADAGALAPRAPNAGQPLVGLPPGGVPCASGAQDGAALCTLLELVPLGSQAMGGPCQGSPER